MQRTDAFEKRLESMAVLDVRTVSQLRGIRGRDGSLFDDLVPAFLKSSVSQIERICYHVERRAFAEAGEAVAELTAACGSFGAQRMATVTRELQQLLMTNTAVGVETHLIRLRSELSLVESQLMTLACRNGR